MKTPCEIMMWYVVPVIRSEIAKDLKFLGLNQTEIAELMGVTQVSVSNYLREARGNTVNFNHETKQMIFNLAQDLEKGYITKKDISCRICYICKELKNDSILKKFCYMESDNMNSE